MSYIVLYTACTVFESLVGFLFKEKAKRKALKAKWTKANSQKKTEIVQVSLDAESKQWNNNVESHKIIQDLRGKFMFNFRTRAFLFSIKHWKLYYNHVTRMQDLHKVQDFIQKFKTFSTVWAYFAEVKGNEGMERLQLHTVRSHYE